MLPGTDCNRDDVMMLNGDSCDYSSAQTHKYNWVNMERAIQKKIGIKQVTNAAATITTTAANKKSL